MGRGNYLRFQGVGDKGKREDGGNKKLVKRESDIGRGQLADEGNKVVKRKGDEEMRENARHDDY